VSFAAQVVPIFAGKCNLCHHPDNAVKVDLTRPFDSEPGIIMRPNSWTKSEKKILVVAGDPEASVLFAKVRGGTLAPELGRPMPLHFERLTAQEKQILRDWISEGAKDN
jgi:hypothetical protein